jgi:hexokinase
MYKTNLCFNSDKKGQYHSCIQVLEELGLAAVASETDLAGVRTACELVSRRAAHLASAGVACLLERMGETDVTVAVDGSVYRFHPHFHHLMMDKIAELISPNIKVIINIGPIYIFFMIIVEGFYFIG